jgi:hypothetical protein
MEPKNSRLQPFQILHIFVSAMFIPLAVMRLTGPVFGRV